MSETYQSKVKPYVSKPPCHVGMIKILKIKKMCLYLGSRSPALVNVGWALRVDLSDTASPTPCRVTATELAKGFFDAEIFTPPLPPVLSIGWPDQRAPGLTVEWWTMFAANLAKIDGDVAMHCMGGHGRTGTAAAILIKLYKAWKGKKEPDIVAYLRTHYCDEAVETDDQLDYLELFDIMTGEQGSNFYHKPAATSYYDPKSPAALVSAGAGSKLNDARAGQGRYDEFWTKAGL